MSIYQVRSVAFVLLSLAWAAQLANLPPPPGRLVDVGGRKLHLNCTGSGSPTVVFEAGASSFAIDFSLVQAELARTTRVCSVRSHRPWMERPLGRQGSRHRHHAPRTAPDRRRETAVCACGCFARRPARPAIRRALSGRSGRPGAHRPHARGTAVHHVQRRDRTYRVADRRTAPDPRTSRDHQ